MHCYWTRYMYQRDRSGRREKGEAVKRNMCASMPCQQRKYFFSLRKKTASHSQSCPMPPCELFCQWCVIVPKRVGCESALQSVSKVCPVIHYSSHRPSRNSKLPIWPFKLRNQKLLSRWVTCLTLAALRGCKEDICCLALHQYLACSNTTCAFFWKELSLMNDKD